MPSLRHKRGSLAQIDAAAAVNGLRQGEVYFVTDQNRLTVGTAVNQHMPIAKQSEIGGGGGSDPWTWQKLASDVANSTVTLAPATGLSFAAPANTTYLVEVIGAFQAAAITTGIAMALDIPSGSISGQVIHNISTTGLAANEQIADNATTGVTTGVRVANTNVPITGRFVVAIGATGGTVQLNFRSEIAASAVTLRAGLTAMGRRII
jgi:hypothetical protein